MKPNDETEYRVRRLDLSQLKGLALRTAGCTLLFCEKGHAVVSANFERQIIRKGCVAIVFTDTYFSIERASRQSSVLYLDLSSTLLDDTTFSLSIPFWEFIGDNPILTPNERQQNLLAIWMKQMAWIMSVSSKKHARLMLRNHLCNLFVGMESELLTNLQKRKIKPAKTARTFLNSFFQLVLANCHEEHNVRFYADALCITSHYLSKITQKELSLSPKEFIDKQIVMEIKQLLLTTEMSVKEIATRFHFDSISYLGRYFRRHTGMTPSEFRTNYELGKII